MLMIKVCLKQSTIPEAGIGLFADQDIKEGTITWKFCEGFDQKLPSEIKEKLSKAAKEQFDMYTYKRVRENDSYYVLCGDNDRFINHSSDPNIREGSIIENGENVSIAVRDIKKGEELLCNYFEFDANAEKKLGLENNNAVSRFGFFNFFNLFQK